MSRTKRPKLRKVDPLLAPTVFKMAAISQPQSVALPAPVRTEAYLQQLEAVPDHNAFQPRPEGSEVINNFFDDRRRVVITRDNTSS